MSSSPSPHRQTTRARAPRRSATERSTQIAACARALALREGLAALTLRGVAAEAGVTPALVAHYAPSMDELVARTFTSIVAEELAELTGIALGLEPAQAVAALVGTLLGGDRDVVTVIWVEAWSMGRRSPALAAEVHAQMDAWSAMLREVVERGVAAGSFRAEDPGEVAWQLLGMIDGLNAQALVRWGDTTERAELMLRATWALLGAQ